VAVFPTPFSVELIGGLGDLLSLLAEEVLTKNVAKILLSSEQGVKVEPVPTFPAPAPPPNHTIPAEQFGIESLGRVRRTPVTPRQSHCPGGDLCRTLIGDWGTRRVRSSKRTKIADEGRDWYSWLLPSLCLILLADLLLKHW
jgi:hypothetical protein